MNGMNPMMGQPQMMAIGMNPMMAMGMNPMTPMMGMNPMMAMMMGQQQQQFATSSAAADPEAAQVSAVTVEASKTIDPRVKRLCQEFKTDDKTMQLLSEAMLSREDFDEDIQALHLVMERDVNKGKKASEALRTHVRSLKANRFPGKDLLDPDIWNFATKYELDDRVLNKLITTLKSRPETMKADLKNLDE